jgi:hypothetical protein
MEKRSVKVRLSRLKIYKYEYGKHDTVLQLCTFFQSNDAEVFLFNKGKLLERSSKLYDLNIEGGIIDVSIVYSKKNQKTKCDKTILKPFAITSLEEISGNIDVVKELEKIGVDFNEIENNEKMRRFIYGSDNYLFFLYAMTVGIKYDLIEMSDELEEALFKEEFADLFFHIKRRITPPPSSTLNRDLSFIRSIDSESSEEELLKYRKLNRKSIDKIINAIEVCRANGLNVFPKWQYKK